MPTGFGWEFKTQYQKCIWEHEEYEGREYKDALYEKVNDRIARITFNRPEKRNAFNDRLFADMLAGLHQANDDPDVRVVILRGAGTCFGAGHDLSSPEGEESTPVNPTVNPTLVDYYGFERRRCTKFEDISDFPKITIAQVHGRCIGANQMVAAYCDIIVAAEDAQFGIRGFGNLHHGLFEWPIWPLWSNKAYAGHVLPETSGKETAALGFVNKAVPIDKLEEETLKWAEALSQLSPDVVAITKEWINGTLDITGTGSALRSHFVSHLALQYVRFRPDEVNLYKARRDAGLKGFLADRAKSATPGATPGG
jgi:enoyl-CoA hydratase